MGTYIRLVDYGSQKEKENAFLEAVENKNISKIKFNPSSSDFPKIPGSPIAYWVSSAIFKTFEFEKISNVSEPRIGLATGRNEYYLRLWYEISFSKIGFGYDRIQAKSSNKKWFPYNKGGSFRKWYGNQDYVINWENDGYELQNTMHPDGHRIWAHNFNLEYIFKKHISWSDINTGMMSFRSFEDGFLFDSSGTAAFVCEKYYYIVLAHLNTKFIDKLSKILNPTIHFTPGDFNVLPFIQKKDENIEKQVMSNIRICKSDWDSFETSWDFKKNPLV